MIELTVELAPEMELVDYWVMEVRCVTDIRIGDRLLNAVPYEVNVVEGSSEIKNEMAFSIELVVDRILSWGREWDLAYAGMAARIFVKGDASRVMARTLCIGESRNVA